MAVELVKGYVNGDPPQDAPREITSVFSTVDEAFAQAAADLNVGHDPLPVRILDGGDQVYGPKDLQKAASAAQENE